MGGLSRDNTRKYLTRYNEDAGQTLNTKNLSMAFKEYKTFNYKHSIICITDNVHLLHRQIAEKYIGS